MEAIERLKLIEILEKQIDCITEAIKLLKES